MTSTSDFYPRPPWGGRPQASRFWQDTVFISIHALRGEGDVTNTGTTSAAVLFLSTPSVGRATRWPVRPGLALVFLSTPSVGRATLIIPLMGAFTRISIHALRGEGDLTRKTKQKYWRISIHALRGEGDADTRDADTAAFQFLSTPSVGRATGL